MYNYLNNCVFQNTLKCGYIGPHGCGFQYNGFSIQVKSQPGPMNSYAGPKMSLPIQCYYIQAQTLYVGCLKAVLSYLMFIS